MADVETSEVGAKLAPTNVKFCMLIDLQLFNKVTFARNQKYEHGSRLKVKIHTSFCGDCCTYVRQIKFGTMKDHGHKCFI
jgi:hypothetical protein